MPQAQRTIFVSRPPETVFAFFTDPTNDPRWRAHVKEIASHGPPAVGATIHQVVSGPAGRGIPADIEITDYERPSRYAFKVTAGPVRPRGEFHFSAVDAGTDVTFSLSAEIGGWKKLFMSGPVQKSMDEEMAGLDAAKDLLEAG